MEEERKRGRRCVALNSDDSIRQVQLATLKGASVSGFARFDFNRSIRDKIHSSLGEPRSCTESRNHVACFN